MDAQPHAVVGRSARRPLAPPSTLHADLADLAFLVGTWSGTGEGVWPPGEPFDYAEDLIFEHVGDRYLLYAQRSWSLEDGSPIHFERGFLRPAGPGVIELMLAHPIGITEVAVGTLRDRTIAVSSTSVSLTPTASPVTELRRRIVVVRGRLSYELHMAMDGVDLRWHVRSLLERA